jgi:hypothetical protein
MITMLLNFTVILFLSPPEVTQKQLLWFLH